MIYIQITMTEHLKLILKQIYSRKNNLLTWQPLMLRQLIGDQLILEIWKVILNFPRELVIFNVPDAFLNFRIILCTLVISTAVRVPREDIASYNPAVHNSFHKGRL